jgi:hypothetical protein
VCLAFCANVPAQPAARRIVDASTMEHKLLMGYQGWFACPGDGSPADRWVHWFRDNRPVAANATVDLWPDVSELGPDELFATEMTLPNGAPAKVYSAYTPKTVLRHFQWMQQYDLDGVLLQRFICELSEPRSFSMRNQAASDVQAGAEKYGRVFAIMYDITGASAATLVGTLTNDWNFPVRTRHLTDSPRYLRHRGRPVVAIWGFGFADRPGTPDQAQAAINFFKSAGCTVLGGVPSDWRTLRSDAATNAAWAAVYHSFDVISPWSVGRYRDAGGVDRYSRYVIARDLAGAKTNGCDYMPVIWPGFSWHNLKGNPLNQVPRRGGEFYWRQACAAVTNGCAMLYGAMLDEVDEGTAMFKLAPTAAQLPAEGEFLPLNADGVKLPSDWYLRLAGQAGKMLRGETPARNPLPIAP